MKVKGTEVYTRVVEKEYSPLIVRRYSQPITHFVAIITDDNLSDLDKVVMEFWRNREIKNDIQIMRNYCGELTEVLKNKYTKAEGIAVIGICDKLVISSLFGDFMNSLMCRLELYQILNFMNLV
jgi:hypothetical protein